MPYYWGHGAVGLMPEGMSSEDAVRGMLDDPERWLYDHVEGMLDSVPRALWHDEVGEVEA